MANNRSNDNTNLRRSYEWCIGRLTECINNVTTFYEDRPAELQFAILLSQEEMVMLEEFSHMMQFLELLEKQIVENFRREIDSSIRIEHQEWWKSEFSRFTLVLYDYATAMYSIMICKMNHLQHISDREIMIQMCNRLLERIFEVYRRYLVGI